MVSVDIWYNSGGIHFGGITAKTNSSSSKANFSNSDYSADKPFLLTFDTASGYNGDYSFSSDQMKTDNFLNQLNTYSFIEEGNAIWSPDENGYPCITDTHPALLPEPIEDNDIRIDETNFPDANFRKYLLEQDYGKDGVITDDEIKGITSMSISEDVSNLKGIEYFANLNYLSIWSDELTSLDLSKNAALYHLLLYSKKLNSNVLESIINNLPLNVYTKRHEFIVGDESVLSSQLIANTRKQGWTPCYLARTAFGVTIPKYPGDDPTGINLIEPTLTINVGESFFMGYTMTPTSAVRDVTWSSDDSSIAYVDYEGVVRGYNPGTTYIIATTNNGITGSCKVIVKEATLINNVKAAIDSDVPIYNLSGQLLNKPRKGINIIGGKKVIVK